MINKKITYTDYEGVERTETFWFHLSRPELMELETSIDGGFSKLIRQIVDSKSTRGVIENIKKILLLSYGEKVDNGRRFAKSEEISKAFSETPAYEILYLQLLEDQDSLSRFINGLVPKDLAEQVSKMSKEEIDALIDNPNRPGLNE